MKKEKEQNQRRGYESSSINLLALPIEQDKISIKVWTLIFPRKLFDYIKALEENIKYKSNLPSKQLCQYLNTSVNDILHVSEINLNSTKNPWLYSIDEIDLEYIKSVIRDWFNIYYKQSIDESLLDELKWIEQTLDIRLFNREEVTAKPDGLAFNLLMRYVSVKLAEILEVEIGDRKVQFYSAASEKGAELISWPPITEEYTMKNGESRKSAWSYKLMLTIQTIPFYSKPCVYIHLGIVRWQMNRRLSIRGKKQMLHPYIMDLTNQTMGENKAKFVKVDLTINNGDKFYVAWNKLFFQLLEQWGEDNKLVNQYELIKAPYDSLFNKDKFIIAVPYGQHFSYEHSIKAGAGFNERLFVAEKVKTELGKIISIQNNFINIKQIPKKIQHNKRDEKELCFNEKYTIEIYYNDINVYKALEKEVYKAFDSSFYKNLEVKAVDMSQWGTDFFNIERSKGNETTEKFIKSLSSKLGIYEENTLVGALFEIGYKDSFSDGAIDPKIFCRKAFAESGRLVQFINPVGGEKDNIARRSTASVQDLQRQLGILNLKNDVAKSVGIDTAHLGMWLIAKNKDEYTKASRFVVLISIYRNNVYMNIPSMDKNWYSYREGLIKIGVWKSVPYLKNEECTNNLYMSINSFKKKFKPEHIVLYTEAHNFRRVLTWLRNPDIHDKYIALAVNEPIEIKDMSMIRVRDEDNNEAPEWVTFGKLKTDDMDVDEYNIYTSLKSGLYKFSDRVFFSVGNRPDSAKKMLVDPTKIEASNNYFRRETALEICVPYAKEGYTSQELAIMAHKLRKDVAIQVERQFTIMPLPLHLAEKAEEYVVNLK